MNNPYQRNTDPWASQQAPQQPPGDPWAPQGTQPPQGQPGQQQGAQQAPPGLNDAMGGSSLPKAAFHKGDPVNTSVGGPILDVEVQQNRDFRTKEPTAWDDGRPQWLVIVSVQTSQQDDPDDDGVRGFYLKTWGVQRDALLDAVKQFGGADAKPESVLVPGNEFWGRYTGERASQVGDPEKVYEYMIRAGHAPPPKAPAAPQAPPQQQAPPPAPVQQGWPGPVPEEPPF